MSAIQHLWTSLGAMQVFWLAVTLGAYMLGNALQRACGGSALASPVLAAIMLVASIVVVSGTDYKVYAAQTQFMSFLLGPATVALAVPLARSVRLVRENLLGVGLAVLAGSVTSIGSGIGLVWLFGGSRMIALSMAPKAATTPIAVAVSSQIGGVPALTAALAILGGILAAALGRKMLTMLKIDDWRAHGLAAGIAGSGIAAAEVAARSELGAAFAALGIGLNGLIIGFIAPALVQLWK
ncbi:LrgB family protein [Bradyrhizobium sp. th.b2]|uniref:LrgB family protein n=1 Tax=Bradyrhizobium sp. th-b2 TaxID=172088 RepID=UPI000407B4AF|nr:LrgB family protein [Bradyrhizobium sp. th.b2]